MDRETIKELFEAAYNEDPRLFNNLAEEHYNELATVRNKDNQTLLHATAGWGRKNRLAYLIEAGADVNALDSEGQAPIHYACNHRHFNVSQKLLEAGANVDLRDNEGWSPMHWVLQKKENKEKISTDYWKIVNLLLNYGADPYLKTLTGRRCIDRIKNREDRKKVELIHLLYKLDGCESDEDDEKEKIIDKYMSVSNFFEIVKSGDESLQLLTTLTTRRLLNERLESCDCITPLHRAAGYNHLKTALLFIGRGAQVDAGDNFERIPLHNAAQYGHVEMIELLVNAKSDINKRDKEGYSPLHVAASNRTFLACLKLIELGADKTSKCKDGKTPFDLAESDDVREVLKPNKLEVIPSTSGQAIYIDVKVALREVQDKFDELMLDSSSPDRLFRSETNPDSTIKNIILFDSKRSINQEESVHKEVKRRMVETIITHPGHCKGYQILSVEKILNEKVWYKYRLKCKSLEIDYGYKNEKLLFHGSNFIDNIQINGFDESYAQRENMFGAGLYFAEHSSKSDQYVFGWGQGCQKHKDKACCICVRKMIYAQVALGKSLLSKDHMENCAHGPPGYSSVTGWPESTDNLLYPEYVIYSGDQAYPLFVITYRTTS